MTKKQVWKQVELAVRRGELKAPDSCEHCDDSGVRLNAHHEDYSKPLDVVWLCGSCHSDAHEQNVYTLPSMAEFASAARRLL